MSNQFKLFNELSEEEIKTLKVLPATISCRELKKTNQKIYTMQIHVLNGIMDVNVALKQEQYVYICARNKKLVGSNPFRIGIYARFSYGTRQDGKGNFYVCEYRVNPLIKGSFFMNDLQLANLKAFKADPNDKESYYDTLNFEDRGDVKVEDQVSLDEVNE